MSEKAIALSNIENDECNANANCAEEIYSTNYWVSLL